MVKSPAFTSLTAGIDDGGKSGLDIIAGSGLFPNDISGRQNMIEMTAYINKNPRLQRQLLRLVMSGYEFIPAQRAEHLYQESKKHWIYASTLVCITAGLAVAFLFGASGPLLFAGSGLTAIASMFAGYAARRFKKHGDLALSQTFSDKQQSSLIQISRDGQKHRVQELFKHLKPMCPYFMEMLPTALQHDTLPTVGKNQKGKTEGGTPGAQSLRAAAEQQASVDSRRQRIGSGKRNHGSSSIASMTAAQAAINARRIKGK